MLVQLISYCQIDSDSDPERAAELARVAAYPQGPTRKLKADENDIFNETANEPGAKQEVRNERALLVYNRVQHKLTGMCHSALDVLDTYVTHEGRDFNPDVVLTVPEQVDKLILQSTSLENLCQCFSGWYVIYKSSPLILTVLDRSGVLSGRNLVFCFAIVIYTTANLYPHPCCIFILRTSLLPLP